MGLPFSDHKVLAVGHAYQLITKTHLERPPIDKVEQSVLDVCLPFSKCDPVSALLLCLNFTCVLDEFPVTGVHQALDRSICYFLSIPWTSF